MKAVKKTLMIIFLSLATVGYSQRVNDYAKVTNISSTTITIANASLLSPTDFVVGSQIIIMQMQDDVIGSNNSNNSNYGNLAAIANAGKYEIRTINSYSSTTITINAPLTNTYNTATGSVQIISFKQKPNYTSTAAITGKSWDGDTGGVIALNINGTLTLGHNVNAEMIGFRGGVRSANNDDACSSTTFISSSTSQASKGEGIHKTSNVYTTYRARGKLASGGGGGSANNAGGGGGGNFTSGGNGGKGWNCTSATGGSGLGGIKLDELITSSRVFMGGGGGGGQQNNTLATDGANGGGIILIKANEIKTTACPISISANGGNSPNSGNDGAGGGGAAGSIIFQVNIFTTACLTVSASGGNGGSVGNSGSHGGGGGGGKGFVSYSVPTPPNVTTQSNNGSGGCNSSSSPCTDKAGDPSVSSFPSIIGNTSGPLPIELISFSGECKEFYNVLTWVTGSEKNNDFFTIERTADGIEFEEVGRVSGKGNSNIKSTYEFTDYIPLNGVAYYRLKQTDYNGETETFTPISIKCEIGNRVHVFPNPNEGSFTVQISSDAECDAMLYVTDLSGKEIDSRSITINGMTNVFIKEIDLQSGTYFVTIKSKHLNNTSRVVIGK